MELANGQILDSFVRDGGAADPAEREGTRLLPGLLVEGVSDVVIRAASVRGFRQNLVLRNCRNVLRVKA